MTMPSSLASFCSARTDGCSLAGLASLEPFRILLGREIDALEQFGREYDLRAALARLAHEAFDLGDVGRHVRTEGRLDGGDGDGALGHHMGSCWVMQWNEPPPASPAPSRPRDGTPITFRSGNTACNASSASSCVGVPYTGITTTPLAMTKLRCEAGAISPSALR